MKIIISLEAVHKQLLRVLSALVARAICGISFFQFISCQSHSSRTSFFYLVWKAPSACLGPKRGTRFMIFLTAKRLFWWYSIVQSGPSKMFRRFHFYCPLSGILRSLALLLELQGSSWKAWTHSKFKKQKSISSIEFDVVKLLQFPIPINAVLLDFAEPISESQGLVANCIHTVCVHILTRGKKARKQIFTAKNSLIPQ